MNVLDAFFERAVRNPEAVAICEGDEVRTFGWLAGAVEDMALELRRAGCFESPSGGVPRVALKCPNGIAHVLWAMAVVRGGGCLVPVPSELREPESKDLLARTGCSSLVESGGPEANVFARGGRALVTALERSRDGEIPEEAFAALKPAFIRFSSGTTGDSKGVVLSHRALIERIASANGRLAISESDRVLWVLPMAHHFAVSILLYLSSGAATVLCHSRMADDMLDAALKHGATVFYGAPFHHAVLASEPSGRGWPSLRLSVSTAAPLREEVATAFLGRFGIPITQGFGIIEAGLPLLNARGAATHPLACGVPDDFEVSLVADGVAGDEGEIWLRGPGMFDAYLSPWRPRSGVLEDGWFRTGDLAVRECGGTIRLTGRLKSVINVGGMKCFPEEIEAVLSMYPGVAECRVFGAPDRRLGMVPHADIVPAAPGSPPTGSELSTHCNKLLAAHKVPVVFHHVSAIPKTASGKIKRSSPI